MATKLIELEDGMLVEVEVEAIQARPIAGGAAEKVLNASLDRITPILVKTCRPIVAAWQQLSQDMDIDQAEVALGLSFESEGNLYLTKATAGANITVTMVLKPKAGEA